MTTVADPQSISERQLSLTTNAADNLIRRQEIASHILEREPQSYRYSEVNETVGPGETNIKFELKKHWDIDIRSLQLELIGAVCSSDSGATPYFPDGMYHLIESIDLRVGEKKIIEWDRFWLMADIKRRLGDLTEDNERARQLGYGDRITRATRSASAATYLVDIGWLFGDLHILPLKSVFKQAKNQGNMDVEIVFTFRAANEVLNADSASTTPTWSVTNARLRADGVRVNSEMKALWMREIAQADGIDFHPVTWRASSFSVNAAAESEEKELNIRAGDAMNVFAVTRTNSTLTTVTSVDRVSTYNYEWTSYKLTSGNREYPEKGGVSIADEQNLLERYDYMSRAYGMGFDGLHDQMPKINLGFDEFSGNSLGGVDKNLIAIPLHTEVGPGIHSGGAVDTDRVFEIELKDSAGVSAASTVYWFVQTFETASMDLDSLVSLLR